MAMTNQVIIDIREVMRESGVMPQKKQKSNGCTNKFLVFTGDLM